MLLHVQPFHLCVLFSPVCLHPDTMQDAALMQVGLYDIHGKLPVVKYVPLLDAGKGQSPTSLELGDAMALEDLLAPVGHFKDAIAGALEGLEPSASAFAASSAAPRRGFGGAVQAGTPS